MRLASIPTIAVCIGLYAGAAQAADFYFDEFIPENTSVDYVFTLNPQNVFFGIAAPGRAYFVDSLNPWDPFGVHWSDPGSDLYCSTVSCSETYFESVSGAYMAMYSSFHDGKLTVHFENRLKEFNVCAPGGPKYCGLEFGDAQFYLRARDAGDSVGVSITRGSVPESATWAMMIAGFGMVGASLRRRHAGLNRA